MNKNAILIIILFFFIIVLISSWRVYSPLFSFIGSWNPQTAGNSQAGGQAGSEEQSVLDRIEAAILAKLKNK